MDKKNIILIAIAILVIALIALGAYIITSNSDSGSINDNATVVKNTTDNNSNSKVFMLDKDGNVTNDTVAGNGTAKNDTNTSNETHRVYNPQTDSYVTVIGEGYDVEVDRWYTYDTDGVRYYNTRIK